MASDMNSNDENKPVVAKKGLWSRIMDFLKSRFTKRVVSDREYSELESVADNNATADVISHSEKIIGFAEKAMDNHFRTLRAQRLEERAKGMDVVIPKEMPDDYEVEHLPEAEQDSFDSYLNDQTTTSSPYAIETRRTVYVNGKKVVCHEKKDDHGYEKDFVNEYGDAAKYVKSGRGIVKTFKQAGYRDDERTQRDESLDSTCVISKTKDKEVREESVPLVGDNGEVTGRYTYKTTSYKDDPNKALYETRYAVNGADGSVNNVDMIFSHYGKSMSCVKKYNGRDVFQMVRTPSETTIYEYGDNGEVLDTYRYDSNGRPIDTVESRDRFGNVVVKPKIYEGVVAICEPNGDLNDRTFNMYYDSLMKAGIPEEVYRGATQSVPQFEPFDFEEFREANSDLFSKRTANRTQSQSRKKENPDYDYR